MFDKYAHNVFIDIDWTLFQYLSTKSNLGIFIDINTYKRGVKSCLNDKVTNIFKTMEFAKYLQL